MSNSNITKAHYFTYEGNLLEVWLEGEDLDGESTATVAFRNEPIYSVSHNISDGIPASDLKTIQAVVDAIDKKKREFEKEVAFILEVYNKAETKE